MKIGAAFPSKYLRANDIPEGRQVQLIMDHVAIENVAGNNDPEDEKPVIYFRGKTKGMVLNKTNSTSISQVYGDETEDWSGHPIVLYASETTFQGKVMPCLRVKASRKAVQQEPAAVPARQPVASPVSEEPVFDDSDIPF